MGATPPPSDEVSLRDLYLVVRRSVPAIALFVAAVVAVTYGLSATRPASFRAEATTAVARAPIAVQEEVGLAFRPELDVTYDTYQTLAFSRGVLERVLVAVPSADISVQGARDGFSLERLAGAATAPSSLLAVAHRVRHGDARIAAELATAWSRLTIETVRGLLNENLEAIERITTDAVAGAGAAVELAEEALRALHEGDAGRSDPQRLAGMSARLADLDARADELARLVSAREAEAASLAGRLEDGGDELVVLADARDVALTVAGALWATEARLAALRAEGETVAAQRAALREESLELLPGVVRFQIDVDRQVRAVAQAQRAHERLADIEPTVAYVAQLAPTGARVLGEAAVPTRPEPRRTVVTSVLSGVAAAFIALVFVLLREAVRDPASGAAEGTPRVRRRGSPRPG